MYPVTPSIRSTVSSSKSIAVPVVTTTQHATRSATLTILATRTITSSPSGKTTTMLDLKTSRHMVSKVTHYLRLNATLQSLLFKDWFVYSVDQPSGSRPIAVA